MNAKIDIHVFWHFAAPVYKDAVLYMTGLPRVQWVDIAHAEWQHLRPNIQNAILEVLKGCTGEVVR